MQKGIHRMTLQSSGKIFGSSTRDLHTGMEVGRTECVCVSVCVCVCVCVCAKSLQSRLTLCDPMDYSPPDSSIHGILQARILDWVAMPSSRVSSQPGDRARISYVSALAGGFFTTSATWEVPPVYQF